MKVKIAKRFLNQILNRCNIMNKENTVYEKSKNFALRIVRLYKYIKDEKNEYVLTKQLLRAGTSIGANIVEAIYAISRKEFLSKMYIAFKECNETAYWLELLYKSDYLKEEEYNSIYKDCSEIKKLLSAITKTVKENQE